MCNSSFLLTWVGRYIVNSVNSFLSVIFTCRKKEIVPIDTGNLMKKLRNAFIGDYLENTESFHKRSQVTLLCNIALVVGITGFAVSIVGLVLGTYPTLVASLGNMLLAGIALMLMRSGQIRLAAGFYFTALYILLFGSLIFNYGVMHIGSPFWVMMLNILVMYILGIRWGIVFLTASAFAFSYYLIFVLPISLELIHTLPEKIYYSVVYETAIALFFLGYTIASILRASHESDQLLLRQNQELTQRNAEKTVMLKEIHHRVKNNLQVIVSLMRLKMHELNSSEAEAQYRDTINRVMAMSKIHEKMYSAEEITNVDLEKYFDDLSKELIFTYQTDRETSFRQDIRIKQLDLDQIVPLALIFNELFSNSLEHAFENINEPRIDLLLDWEAENGVVFEYRDNGVWKTATNQSSFGLDLIQSLTEQLNGTLTAKVEPTHYRLVFPAARS